MGLETAVVMKLVSAGIQGVGSFAQMRKAKKDAENAQMAADNAVLEAQKILERNPFKDDTINTLAYELEREERLLTSTAAMLDGNNAANVSFMANASARQTRSDMTDDLRAKELRIDNQEAKNNENLAQIQSDIAEGAASAVADANARKAAAATGMMDSVTDMASIGFEKSAQFKEGGEDADAAAKAAAAKKKKLTGNEWIRTEPARGTKEWDKWLNTLSDKNKEAVMFEHNFKTTGVATTTTSA